MSVRRRPRLLAFKANTPREFPLRSGFITARCQVLIAVTMVSMS